MSSRRPPLETIDRPNTAHGGLWYDKYLAEQPQRGGTLTPYVTLVESFQNAPTPPTYPTFHARWLDAMNSSGAIVFEARTRGRQVVGLGGAGVIENGITLHHTYGVPYLPGSALKGLAAHYAHNFLQANWRKGSEAHNWLFGTQRRRGVVTFHDALPSRYSFEPDILTVHHRDYYQQGKTPADWDNPTPIPFLTVGSGVFHIPLAGPEAWVEAAVSILHGAVAELGIGAKTHSGYGRMRIEGVRLPKKPPKPIVLEEGVTVPAVITRVGVENVELWLDPDRFINVDADMAQLVFFEKPVGITLQIDDEVQCYVSMCDIEENSIFVECRLVS